ncbi:methyltransferase [Paenibacillus silvae]|uniref:Methyltransferase n=1 Tax=Paenibacillus silvae TaxID=1325358 RepID=A0ABQ1Z6X3_9BACL|nr:methyltransferase domain-containing protein [Paenibacillus silvae]GGH50262.1 methyltransferase [Paenibacillus silvae]
MKVKENMFFLRSFMQNPKHIGSVIPSSRFLAKKMVKQAPWREVKAIAELGSGTGAITRHISNHVTDSMRVLLFEMNDTMRTSLEQEFPQYSSYKNAANLVECMKQQQIEQLDCIFSGLPFFNFESELRKTLVDQIVQALKPGGLFIAFQYSLQMKKILSEHFIIETIPFVPLNIPPAFVYVCRKKETLLNHS